MLNTGVRYLKIFSESSSIEVLALLYSLTVTGGVLILEASSSRLAIFLF